MSILSEERPAREFVQYMHGNGTNLKVFVKLLCKWAQLTPDERQEVYDICELEHPSLYHDLVEEEEDEGSWES